MKSLKVSLIIIAAMAVVLGLSGMSFAFHAGGVAHCNGCHSMHDSADNPVSGAANTQLLKGSDASSTCLNCHNGTGSYHVRSTDGSNAKAGGDFYWIGQEYYVVVRNNTTMYGGDNAGHNIIATDFGLAEDQNPSNAQAPGGTYSASKLGCTSCHDAHGQVHDGTKGGNGPIETSGSYDACKNVVAPEICGNYRLLGDSDYEAGNVTTDGYAFSNDAPIAEANGSNGAAVDYGTGMSEWCGNCHDAFNVGSSTQHKHPASSSSFLNGQAAIYNSYIATGNYSGTSTTSYDPIVPFERGTAKANHTDLDPALAQYGEAGPDSTSNVMCLTCHRAHATGNENAGRWDFETEFVAETHSIEAILNGSVPATAVVYYANGSSIDIATQYGEFQRSLCNKCHAQD